MVEYNNRLDAVFQSLADSTRRDILRRLLIAELSVSELGASYNTSLAAVSKHLIVLETAGLIEKRRQGRQRIIRLRPTALQWIDQYLEQYRGLWAGRLDRLEQYLEQNKE